jgi:hypothetical protein
MTRDFAKKDYTDTSPWWLPLFWLFAMVVCVYLWIWIVTGVTHHIDCWSNDDSMGCALVFNSTTTEE